MLRRSAAKVIALAVPPRADVTASLDDAQLIAATARGDATAATAICRRIAPVVERTVGRMLSLASADFDDVVQDALVAVIRSLPSFRGDCSLDTWVARITARTVYREWTRRASVARTYGGEPSETVEASEPSSSRRIEARDLCARLRRHLEAMDPARASAVVLHDVCGHDLREVAEIMQTSVAAAQSRLFRGRVELHERIAADADLADMLATRADGRDR